ncbi:MAG TPA: helix-turn-helix domain-containing protein [Clostridia bacterium]|nr:helix-turn-helix domain-containing protein [Clostridia bacterium]
MIRLNLDEFNVLEKKEREGTFLFVVEKNHSPTVCPHCMAGEDSIVKHGKRERYVRDSSIDGHPVDLLILHGRYKCKYCGKTFYETIECTDGFSRITNRFKDSITKECYRKSFLQVARDCDVSHTTVMRVFDESMHSLDLDRKIYTPEILTINRIFINRELLTLFCDPENELLLDINRDISDSKNTSFLDIMDPDFRNIIFADPFYMQSRFLHNRYPYATFVLDRFQVEKFINRIFKCKIRKTLWYKKIKNISLLNEIQYDFINNLPYENTKFEHAFFRLGSSPLFQSYRMLMELKQVYESENRKEAEIKYNVWKNKAKSHVDPFYGRMASVMDKLKMEFLNYFNYPHYHESIRKINNLPHIIESQTYTTSFEAARGRILFGNSSIQNEEKEIRQINLKRPAANPKCSILVRNKTLGVHIPSLIKEIEQGHF